MYYYRYLLLSRLRRLSSVLHSAGFAGFGTEHQNTVDGRRRRRTYKAGRVLVSTNVPKVDKVYPWLLITTLRKVESIRNYVITSRHVRSGNVVSVEITPTLIPLALKFREDDTGILNMAVEQRPYIP